jgi:hypothetical protein
MGSRTSILVDDSLWPLLRVTFPSVITNEQHKDLLERRLFYLQRRERHVSLIDMRQLRYQWSMGIVTVVNSPVLALVVRILIHRIRPSVVPYSILTSWPAAVSWVVDRLETDGLSEHARRVRQCLGSSCAGERG